MYRAMWNRCKQFWTAPDYIRVTDDEGSPQFIGINQPIPGPPQVVMGEGGMPQIQPSVLGYDNALAELDVDIVLDVVPDTAALGRRAVPGPCRAGEDVWPARGSVRRSARGFLAPRQAQADREAQGPRRRGRANGPDGPANADGRPTPTCTKSRLRSLERGADGPRPTPRRKSSLSRRRTKQSDRTLRPSETASKWEPPPGKRAHRARTHLATRRRVSGAS
jgi:hypothetical protein